MSRELHITYDASASPTLYCCLREPTTGKVWYAAGPAFETWGTFGRTATDYDNAVTHRGGGFWTADFWTGIEEGDYTVIYYQQIGASPADTDPPVAQDHGHWTGTTWISQYDLLRGPGQTTVSVTVRTTAGTPLENLSVWVSDQDDSSTSAAIVQPRTTDVSGSTTFYLTLGDTYYVFCGSNAYTFADATITPVAGTTAFTLDIATAVPASSSGAKKTVAELVERVKYLLGRHDTTGGLPLDAILLDALNEAQRKIAEKCPNAMELHVSDTTTFEAATGEYALALTDLTNTVWHLHRLWLLDGTDSQELWFRPKDWFTKRFPLVSAETSGLPYYWTRLGDTLYLSCPWSSDYDGYDLRLDYTKKPDRFTSAASVATCELNDADDGLILWSWACGLRAIARGQTALLGAAEAKEAEWRRWLDEYQAHRDLETEENIEEAPRWALYDDY